MKYLLLIFICTTIILAHGQEITPEFVFQLNGELLATTKSNETYWNLATKEEFCSLPKRPTKIAPGRYRLFFELKPYEFYGPDGTKITVNLKPREYLALYGRLAQGQSSSVPLQWHGIAFQTVLSCPPAKLPRPLFSQALVRCLGREKVLLEKSGLTDESIRCMLANNDWCRTNRRVTGGVLQCELKPYEFYGPDGTKITVNLKPREYLALYERLAQGQSSSVPLQWHGIAFQTGLSCPPAKLPRPLFSQALVRCMGSGKALEKSELANANIRRLLADNDWCCGDCFVTNGVLQCKTQAL